MYEARERITFSFLKYITLFLLRLFFEILKDVQSKNSVFEFQLWVY